MTSDELSYKAVEILKDFMAQVDPDAASEGELASLAKLTGEILEWAAKGDTDTRAEAFVHARLTSPEACGQMLMEILSMPLGTWGMEEKIFFTRVAAIIGPDYIHVMRGVAAFMARTDEFHITVR